MKKILNTLLLSSISITGFAQLYSSGNNTILGNNIGVGVSAPAAKLHVQGGGSITELIRLQNNDSTSFHRFTMINDAGFNNRATFTRYGSKFPGGYPGASTQFPYPNLLAFGCNVGSFLISTNGKVGLSIVSGGTTKLKFFADSTLNLGLGGNAHPRSHVHINNTDGTTDSVRITNNTTGHTNTDGFLIGNNGNTAFVWNRENAAINFGTNNTNAMTLNASGQLLIGSANTPTGYKLFVEQGILTEKVKVAVKNSGEWADYVFDKNYLLMPLQDVEAYINKNKHLPNVPSANEVVSSGLDLGKMDATLLQKVEELTLYMIELQKQNNALQQKVDLLQKAVDAKK
jgi:trimeric autotransporter adhesin